MVRAKKNHSRSAKLTEKLYIKPKSVKALPPAEPPKIESLNIDKKQCSKAVTALVSFAKKRIAEKAETDLLAGEDNEDVWLTVALKQMSPKDNHKPARIPLPNPLLDPRKNPVCLLVKDPQREYKDLLESKKIKFISRVVGMSKLQGKFKPFEARRQLMKENDLFLVDDRIVPEMPRVLGKAWLQAKKSPIPVTLSRADLKGELERAISSTYLRINKGTSLSIKVGSLEAHTPEQLQENLLAIIPHLAIKLPLGGWDNVQSLHIKTTSSIALPIWNCSLGDASDESKEGRFFAAPINKEEIEGKLKAKAIKEDRIQEKKARKLLGASADEIREALEEGSVAGQDAEVEVDGDEDEEAELEEIDESLVVPSSPANEKAKKSSKKTKVKGAATATDDRKTVSSTSKKMKGLDGVKGLPRKASK